MNGKSNTISTKDLSYFCDMFQWNVNCYNAFAHFKNELTDADAIKIAEEISMMHKESCEFILGLINE